jgi:hypothetical protein
MYIMIVETDSSLPREDHCAQAPHVGHIGADITDESRAIARQRWHSEDEALAGKEIDEYYYSQPGL